MSLLQSGAQGQLPGQMHLHICGLLEAGFLCMPPRDLVYLE